MTNKRRRWIYWAFFALFSALGVLVQHFVLPPGHWSGQIVTVHLPQLLAAVAATLYLRARGLSQEARLELVWLNVRRLMAEPPAVQPTEIKTSPAYRWSITILGALLTAFFIWLRFFVQPDQREDSTLALGLIVFCALATVLFWALTSRPNMRLGPDGLSGLGSKAVPWDKIASCRVHSKRNAWGDVGEPKVSLTGTDGRQITVFGLSMTPRSQRRDFLLALHLALLPHEAPPVAELDQVLAGSSGGN